MVSSEDCMKKFEGIADTILISNLLSLQLENTRKNVEIKQAKFARDRFLRLSLEREKLNITTKIVAIQNILQSRKLGNRTKAKDPKAKVHTAEAYNLQNSKVSILTNILLAVGRSLPQDEFEKAIKIGSQDFFDKTRCDLSDQSLEILHEWCDTLPKILGPKKR